MAAPSHNRRNNPSRDGEGPIDVTQINNSNLRVSEYPTTTFSDRDSVIHELKLLIVVAWKQSTRRRLFLTETQ